MSGTLSKSDGGSSRTNSDYSSRHPDYLKDGTRIDSVSGKPLYKPVMAGSEAASGSKKSETYRKDYSRLTDSKVENSSSVNSSSANLGQEYNQKMLAQYADMDKLGDVVIYEIDIMDRRYALLLDQFKTADNQDRDVISRELDDLNANQIKLYKSYIKIYRDGKTDWPKVKSEVETTLLSLRGIDKK